MEKITVIIPVFNCENYLKYAVQSVLDQPYTNINVVLVDDGSRDNSPALCDHLAAEDGRIHVIHQENQGVSVARNQGIEYVLQNLSQEDGGYIGFLDADDVWCPNVITAQTLQFVQDSDNPEIVAFGGLKSDYKMEKFSTPFIPKKAVVSAGNKLIWTLQEHPFCTVLYQKRFMHRWNIRFPKGVKYAEDKIFLMQSTFLAEKACFISKCLHVYRNNPFSAIARAKKFSSMEYYLPIIDAWVASDAAMNALEAETGRHLRAGSVLAGIYFIDMAEKHFKQGGSRDEWEDILSGHPHIRLLLEMNPADVSPVQYQQRTQLLEHPDAFIRKCRLNGMIERVARTVLAIPVAQKFWEKRRYPLACLPEQ